VVRRLLPGWWRLPLEPLLLKLSWGSFRRDSGICILRECDEEGSTILSLSDWNNEAADRLLLLLPLLEDSVVSMVGLVRLPSELPTKLPRLHSLSLSGSLESLEWFE
jgi:hypothetical protein